MKCEVHDRVYTNIKHFNSWIHDIQNIYIFLQVVC